MPGGTGPCAVASWIRRAARGWTGGSGAPLSLTACASEVPLATLASIRKNEIAIKGPTTTPVGGGHVSANVQMRRKLDEERPIGVLVTGQAVDEEAAQSRFPGV